MNGRKDVVGGSEVGEFVNIAGGEGRNKGRKEGKEFDWIITKSKLRVAIVIIIIMMMTMMTV